MDTISIRTHGKQLNHLAWGAKRKHGLTWKAAMQHAFNAMRIKQRLSTGIVNFSFVKVSTGEVRIANGTRDLGNIPAEFHPKGTSTKPETTNVVSFFDVEGNGWKSFDISTLIPALV